MADIASIRGFAVVTGASTGIGFELAKCAALDGSDVIIAPPSLPPGSWPINMLKCRPGSRVK